MSDYDARGMAPLRGDAAMARPDEADPGYGAESYVITVAGTVRARLDILVTNTRDAETAVADALAWARLRRRRRIPRRDVRVLSRRPAGPGDRAKVAPAAAGRE